MNLQVKSAGLQLSQGQTMSVTDTAGARVMCRDGELWITQDDDRRDVVLTAGQSFDFDRPGRALVYALQRASLSLCTPN